uniref:Galactose-3-O-sulfotransferase 4 n=2 Tax=Xenopus tropicalis TaxID=8364 RepID=F6Z1T3_XENTR|eukprot:XP_012808822.1 PREDICTED: galactose-3-O-sulfotransferase 4 isoform X2 [Xenopus tropicalis]
MKLVRFCRQITQRLWLFVLLTLGVSVWLLGTNTQQRRLLGNASEDTCRAKNHIMFLKTHKTAGSSILNILHRYGDRNSLNFALPYERDFNYSSYFNASWVKGFNNASRAPYDILCHHMRLNISEVGKVMPSDSFYFTILRDPAAMAESAFSYYRTYCPTFKEAPNLKAFIYNTSLYYRPNNESHHYARNLLWFDLGMDPDEPFTEEMASEGVRAVEDAFNLVLFAEHFDESVILLKEELCWELDDILTFKLNARETPTQLEQEDIERLRAWNSLDWYLYVYFNRTFWDKVERFGRERMDMELRRLRERRQQLAELCLEGLKPLKADEIQDEEIKPYQPTDEKILGWKVRHDLRPSTKARCVQMITPEVQYKYLLDDWQFPEDARYRAKEKELEAKKRSKKIRGKKPEAAPVNKLAVSPRNKPDMVAENKPEVVAGNKPEVVAGNKPDMVVGNKPEVP